MGAVARSWGEMAAENLGGAFCGGGGCGRQELGRGGDREPWELSVGEEAASSGVGARWRQRALGTAESLGNAPWVRVRVWSPGVGERWRLGTFCVGGGCGRQELGAGWRQMALGTFGGGGGCGLKELQLHGPRHHADRWGDD